MNPDNFVHFVLISPKKRAFSFVGYTDQDGEYKTIPTGIKYPDGTDKHRRFRFTNALRKIRIPKHEKETIEFLRNHPNCDSKEKEPWRAEPMFRELNSGRDAKIANAARRIKIEAESIALNLEGESLTQVAALLGCFNSDEEIKMHHVSEYASAMPDKFLKIAKSGDLEVRSLIRSCLNASILTKKGSMILWKEELIGNNEDDAVAKLLSDGRMKGSIKSALTRSGKK